MKKVLLGLIVFFLTGTDCVKAQPNYINQVFDFGFLEVGSKIIVEDSFCIYSALGYVNMNETKILIIKMDDQMMFLDSLVVGESNKSYYEVRYNRLIASKGNKEYIGTATLYEPGDPDPGFYYFKFDEDMNLLWEKTYRPSVAKNVLMKCIPSEQGEFYLAGYIRYPDSISPLRFYLGRFDTLGSMMWERVLGDTLHFHHLYDATRTSDRGFLLCGTRWTNADKDIYIVKTDSLGNMEWDRVYGGAYDDFAFTCSELSKGNYMIAGSVFPITSMNSASYLLKLDSIGGKVWDKTFRQDDLFDPWLWQMVKIDSFLYYVGGGDKDDINIGSLTKVTESGNEIWNRTYTYNPTNSQYLWDVAQTTDNSFIMVGQAIGTQGQDVWIVKTDSLGCLVPSCDTATGTAIQIIPAPGNALQAWPNPAREVLYVAHNGYTGQEVSYRLISLSGQVVQSGTATLPKGISLQSIQGGIYILQLTTPEGTLIGTSKVAISK